MRLSAAFLIAFGPVLTTCLAPPVPVAAAPLPVAAVPVAAGIVTVAPVPGTVTVAPLTVIAEATAAEKKEQSALQNTTSKWLNDWKSQFQNPTSTEKCVVAPMVPTTFFAKRKFSSFRNVITFEDQHGTEFGFVESWFIDWKNPFGYAGASFHLKAPPAAATQGIWAIDPKRGENGWTAPTPAPAVPAQDLKQQEDALFEKEKAYDREHGTSSASYHKPGFLQGMFGDDQNRLSAYMTGVQTNEPWGEPFVDQMTVRDCQGTTKFVAGNGVISETVGGVDAHYNTEQKDTENTVSISDLGVPSVQMVRLQVTEPCVPFPPFCAQMGMWNWFIHVGEWQGRITQPGYNQSVGGGLLSIKMTDGAATDMRFLALYSAYQFSNTRWSPLMGIVTNVLLLLCCCGCCRCCYSGCRAGEPEAPKVTKAAEETEKLLKTVEGPPAAAEPAKPASIFACCSRGGRSVDVRA